MRRLILGLLCVGIVAAALPSFALNIGQEILVPAAGRVGNWVTDLYIMNPGTTTVDVAVYWLVRGQANPSPTSTTFALLPGETAVMEDVISAEFGVSEGGGAFRVSATGDVVVNSRIYSLIEGETFGQGFEGVPVAGAVSAGESANIVGLTHNDSFRTNFYALAGANGATLSVSLREPDGDEIASTTLTLDQYEPYLRAINQLLASGSFDNGTLKVTVTAGSAVFGASKVDELSEDPTTLEAGTPMGGAGSIDGTYQFALYDSASFAAGGNLVISNGQVTAINGTYMNWDKGTDPENPDCTLIFLWGLALTPTDVEDFQSGVTFMDSYSSTGSGEMTWTVQFDVDDNMALTGSVTAVGANFPSTPDDQSGCNGSFPALTLNGGKTE